IGFGGRFLQEANVKIIFDFTHRSSVGFLESIPYIFDHFIVMQKALDFISKEENRPDLAILIDNQGFNIPFASRLKKLGIKTIYYFPPPLSIWGKSSGKKLVKTIDYFFVPFLADYQEYTKLTENAFFYGHPFFDKEYLEEKMAEQPPEDAYFDKFYFLLPGSRQQEIDNLLKPFIEVADYLYEKYKLYAYLPVANNKFLPRITKEIGNRRYIKILDKCYYSLYKDAKFVLMASGSATLEALLLKIPHIICYKVSAITFFIGKMLVKTNHVGMSNILAGEEIAFELLQKRCNKKEMIKRIEQILDPEFKNEVVKKLERVSSELFALNKSSSLLNFSKKALEILNKS
ncbi:MAG: lipid-A-disaccharide synthase, partial [Exilispira sp.]